MTSRISAQFAVIGGTQRGSISQVWGSMRLFSNYESALAYAQDILATFDYAYVSVVNADGTVNPKQSIRVNEEAFPDLAW